MKLYISKILVILLCSSIIAVLWFDKLKKVNNTSSDEISSDKLEQVVTENKIDHKIEDNPQTLTENKDSLADKIKDYIGFLEKLEEIRFLVSNSKFIEANIILEQTLAKSYAKAKLEEFSKLSNKIKESSELKPEQIFPENNFFIVWIEGFFKIEKYNKSQNQKNIEEILFNILRLREYYYETKNLETMLGVL